MAILYSITFKAEQIENMIQTLKVQVIAENQIQALEMVSDKAKELKMKITKLEEIHKIGGQDKIYNGFLTAGKIPDKDISGQTVLND